MVANLVVDALTGIAGTVGSMFTAQKQAEESSALQYKYQTKLNKQNYKTNVKLINLQNAFNEAMMDKANAFNERMWNASVDLSNTAHQREVADLRRAGLNPILSANGGASTVNPIQSAQTSSGNSQLSNSAGMPDVDYLSAMETAMNMRNNYKSVESTLRNDKTNRLYTSALTDKVYSDVQNSNIQTAFQKAKADAEVQEIKANIARNDKLAQSQIAKNASEILANQSSSARQAQETKNLAEDFAHYGVERYFGVGPVTLRWKTHPNEKHKSPGNSINSTYKKGVHYEIINGHKVPVRSY